MSWITGAGILERPGWGLKAELANAFKAGLRPFRDADGAMLTARIVRDGRALDMGSRCFHCVHGSQDRGYMATGCPRNDTGQNIDIIIQKIVKPGIEELRGKVDKALFRDGLPSNVFDFPGYSADADFVQFVEDQVGPDNLRAMLIESRCIGHEPADQNEVCDRLKAARFRLSDVQAFEDWHGIGQDGAGQVEEVEAPESMQPEVEHEPTNAAEYAAWRKATIRSIHNGQLMLEIQERWGKPPLKTLTREEIAALVLEPEAPPPNNKTDGSRWESLKSAFKNNVYSYRKQLKQEAD